MADFINFDLLKKELNRENVANTMKKDEYEQIIDELFKEVKMAKLCRKNTKRL